MRGNTYDFNRLVIDGQQRLITISLFLLAGIKAVKNGLLDVESELVMLLEPFKE
jgi:uncharacterized protein with ParB-like and HNH nuclease domain